MSRVPSLPRRAVGASPLLSCLGLLLLAGCAEEISGPTPRVASPTDPHLVCNVQLDTPVTLTGSGFSPLAVDVATGPGRLVLPEVSFVHTAGLDGAAVSDATPIVVPGEDPATTQVHWLSQMQMVLDVTESLALPVGVHAVEVENPNGAKTRFEGALVAVPPPLVERIEPMAICTAQGDSMLRIIGRGLLDVAGEVPTVTLSASGTTRTYDAMSLTGCTALPAPATEARTCTEFTIVVPQGDLAPGTYGAVVTNPAPAACSSTAPISVEVVPPPELSAIAPTRICTGGGSFVLSGTGFRPGATVSAGMLTASSVDVAAGGASATAMFGLGLDPGTYDVTITNPEGCTDTLAGALNVVEGPILFWVDPSVVYNGITTQITLYASGVSASTSITSVAITAEDGTRTALTFTRDGRGRIQALLPVGTPAGTYDVAVEADGCPAILPDGLRVTDTLSLTVDRVEAPFGWRDEPTAVTIFGSGFTSTPRVYLNPDMPSPTTVATPLLSVGFVDGTRLTAQVPPGLPAGVYDVIVVNPDGAVGLRDQGFTVTAAAPPVLDSVSPGQVDSGAVRNIAVTGSGFTMPTAAWTCRDTAGGTMMLAGTVTASTATTASVTLNTGALGAGTVCVLRLTNPDGTFGDYSAVAITTPASNLQPFRTGSALGTARRAPAVTSGRATRAARFVYALGGDSGTVGGALSSTEAAPVDPFGALGAWFAIPGGLPANRTLARVARVGRFLYLVGGNDGTAAITDVSRAEILDPAQAPIVTDLAARRGMGMGLGAGVWTYRVSAVFGPTDPQNPGGESLASDPVPVRLPAGLPDVLRITLDWSEVPGAVAYRVYRSPTADAAVGGEQLVAEVAARSFEDDGRAPIEARGPLPLGAHGRWAAMPALGTARSGFGIAIALDPVDESSHHVYAIGGRSSAGAPLATYEFLTVRVSSPRTHVVAASWTAGATNLGVARADLSAYTVDNLAAPIVPLPRTYIYAGNGAGATGSVSNVDVGEVQIGGQLTAWSAVDASRNVSGYAAAAGNGFLYLFGGGPTAGAGCFSAEICTGGGGCSGPPLLRNWNNEGISLMTPRYLPGSATESSFIYVVGGTSGTGALASTEQTVL
jgi:hypothetical protein